MAEDLEVGVMLEVDESELEDVEDRNVAVSGGGSGELSTSQAEQQEGIVAGGVSKGLLATGIFGGILSQLKSISGIIEAVFGVLSRLLLPAVEVVADLIRPLIRGLDQFIQSPGEAAEKTANQAATPSPVFSSIPGVNTGLSFSELIEDSGITEGESGENINEAVNNFADFLFGSKSADQTGEAKKQQSFDILNGASRDSLGAFK